MDLLSLYANPKQASRQMDPFDIKEEEIRKPLDSMINSWNAFDGTAFEQIELMEY